VPVKLNSSMPLKNMTADDSNGLLIAVTGNYEVNYNLLLNTSRGVTAAAAIRRNGETIPSTRGSQTMAIDNTSNISYDGRLSASAIIPLTAGDRVDLAVSIVRSLPAGLDAVINGYANAAFSLKYLD
jgi:hypothetical protein